MTQRVHALDALRGFALLGIIMGNVTWFSGYAVATPEALDQAVRMADLDVAVEFGLHMFVDGKFYGLFSLIFGVGFGLMVDSAKARGHSADASIRRRLVVLFTIGLAHGLLLWFGDIVSLYAVAAIPLQWAHRWPTRRLVLVSAGCLAAPVAIAAGVFVVGFISAAGMPENRGHGPAAMLPAFGSGSYAELLQANAAFLKKRWWLALESGRFFRLLGLFTLGLVLVRLRPRISRRVRLALITAAFVTNLAFALLPEPGLVRELVVTLAIPLGSVAYAAVLWPHLASETRTAKALAAAGRLSLTHYLMQSLAMSMIFYGWGLGLWGKVGLAPALVIAAAIVLAQVCVSQAWLRRVSQGPAEWLLRRLSHG